MFAMYLVFPMIGILFFETVSRTIFNHPWIWTVEMAQFVMAAYYTLGGAYTLIMDGHVRMDLTYAQVVAEEQGARRRSHVRHRHASTS